MRVLMVVNDAAFFLSHRLAHALGFQKRGYDVHVATPADDASPAIAQAGLTFHPFPLTRQGTSPRSEAAAIASLISLYRRVAPDLVHHVTAKPILYGGIAARVARVPAVVHAVSGLGFLFISQTPRAKLLRRAVRSAYRIVTSHPNCAVIVQNTDDLAVLGSAIRTKHVVVIPGSGVDRTVFRATPLPAGPPLVVLPSRMLVDKGVGEFVEAARIAKREMPEVRFALVGGVDEANPAGIAQRTLEDWTSSGVVEWWGARRDMPSVLEQSTLVCLPSYREGMPKSLLEACAAGRPIVTTDVPGCRDVVDGHGNGVTVPARDACALAGAITALLRDPVRLQAMATASAVRSEAFDIETIIEQTLAVYASLLHT